MLHPSFHLSATGIDRVVTTGRYVYESRRLPANGRATGTLIDEQTGTSASLVSPPGCFFAAMGGPWVLYQCNVSVAPAPVAPLELYSIPSGTWQGINSTIGPSAIGSDWIEGAAPGPPCYEHCGTDPTVFQNIQTGAVRSLPDYHATGTTIPNLNSATLSAKLCSPLRVPAGLTNPFDQLTQPGGLSFEGSFAIADEWYTERGGYYNRRFVLERCGTRLRMALDNSVPGSDPAPTGNTHAVVWKPNASFRGAGVFLPSLRRFTFAVPSGAGGSPITLSTRHLYSVTGAGELWTAAAPTQPRRSRR